MSGSSQSQQQQSSSMFGDYQVIDGTFDELVTADGIPRPEVKRAFALLSKMGRAQFVRRQGLANSALLQGGVTFAVYNNDESDERIFPFDLIPRVIDAKSWTTIQSGLSQRVRVLNAFLNDIYGDQRVVTEGIIPREVIENSSGYLPKMRGIRPPHGVYVHIAGIDLIRDPAGQFLVLEDNARTPSGVSYVLENRSVMKRVLPLVFEHTHVRSVDAYPQRLYDTLTSVAPAASEASPTVVVLTPGRFNSAYFEHSLLARRMGCDLVEAGDLFVDDERVWVKTTRGPQQIDVIYRRIDDDFLDPEVFRPDSLLGVPGLVGAYRAGNVTLANAIGNGVADDKAVYPFVPMMTRFYLDEDPILGQVETLSCAKSEDRIRVLDQLNQMVVKEVDGSGGYGMLMGPTASKAELEEFAARIRKEPRRFIAQPRIELSTCPTWIDGVLRPCRVDLRPFVLTGQDSWVLPGGLTRVALASGSYVVNSSQGGGSKDTWILEGQA